MPGLPEWAEGAACVLGKSAAQAIPSGVHSVLTWDVEREDLGGWHDDANPSRIRVPAPGWYRASATISWAVSSASGRLHMIVKNSAVLLGGEAHGAYLESYGSPSWEGRLAAGDYLEVLVFQQTGGNHNVLGPPSLFANTEFRVARAGA
jgi:hypothetical protein